MLREKKRSNTANWRYETEYGAGFHGTANLKSVTERPLCNGTGEF